jgi:FtsH-binding integral membrane protein
MSLQISKSAFMSKTMQFLAAGGLTLAVAVWHEVAKPITDWPQVATMVAGILVGIGGGAYGRVVAQGPVTSVISTPGDK